MKKKLLYISIILITALSLTSCDQVKSLMKIVPKFDNKLPNNVAGKYAYYRNEEEKEAGKYTTLYNFTSTDGTFTKTTESGTEKGSYTVKYKTYAITECNGTITLNYEEGSSESFEFYFYSTAVGGPEYIMLGSRTYYYEGL